MLSQCKGPGEVQAEILMSRQNFKGSFLVVEGDDDSRFWTFRIQPTSCEIVIGGSKPAVIGGISKLDHSKFTGALGVIDDDFDSLENSIPVSQNLISTDTHDLETLLLRSTALDKLLAEYGDRVRIRAFEQAQNKTVIQALLERGLPFGRLRWLSVKLQLAIAFDKLPPQRFLDNATWTLDESALIKAASQLAQLTEQKLTDQLAALPEADPWQICHGHDLIDILVIGLSGVLGNSQPGRKKIASALRLGADTQELNNTRLWQGIRDWQTRNSPYLVLKS